MKKKSKTTAMGILAAALFLMSSPESPVKDLIPEKTKAYTTLGAGLALGLLGKFSADEKPAEKPEEKPEEGK